MISARRLALSLVLLALLAVPVLADDVHPNTQSGVALDQAFQVGEIDNVNLFNGALTLTIPLGSTYPVGGTLSYGLTLVYNSNPWFFFDHAVDANTTYAQSVPNPCSNAGLGWHVSLGRLNPPCTAASETGIGGQPSTPKVYEGPDGAQHVFYTTLHNSNPVTANVLYTRDGSYLRLVTGLPNGESEVDFPDGTLHHFDSLGRPTQIRDAFNNRVNISYGALQWTITDSQGRSQQVYFRGDLPSYAETVDHIVLTAFGGVTATYQFQYTTQTIARGCPNHDPTVSNNVVVPVLSSVTLPDLSTYSMAASDYFLPVAADTPTGQCTFNSGSILGLTLPTLGRIEWSYQTYGFPQGSSLKESRQKSPGVATRTTRDANGVMIGQWSYTTALTPDTNTPELVNTVTDPPGTRVERHFSVSLDPTYTATGWNLYDYGAQLSRYSFAGQPAGWYLSSRTYDSTGRLLRSEYQVPDHDQASATNLPDAANLNHRVLQSRTVYEDDGGRYADLTNSNFDGLGHYRSQQTNGTFPGSNVRTHASNYNPTAGTYAVNLGNNQLSSDSAVPASTDPWALSISNFQWDSENGATAFTETCFQPGSSTLTRKRVHRLDGAASDAADLVTIYDLDGSGNVQHEKSYGGDLQGGMGALNLCGALPTVAPEYEVDSVYLSGTLASAQSVGMPWKSVDRTIDGPTGLLATSKDPAGVVTTYAYDAMGRLTSSRTGASAPTVYTYTPASSANSLARLHVEQQPSGVTPPLRPQRDLTFDGLGRLVREDVRMPSGATSSRTTAYDALGRKTAVSELGNPSVLTQTSYDPFNRPTSIRTPDGETTTLTYTGVRQVSRTVSIGQQYDTTQDKVRELPQTTTEIYDRLGRLYQVTEPLGGGVTTTYGYDVGNRLASVSITALVSGSNVTQNRSFNYDRRGFLLSESHPEKGVSGNGTVSYSGYDSRGHATRKIDGPNDLTFTFDAGERLTEVRKTGTAAACTTGGTNCLKLFTYGTANGGSDLRLGKLVQAQRWNFPVLGGATHVERITANYTYAGLDGRLSQRELILAPDGDATPGAHEDFLQSWSYDDLGHVASETYPNCAPTFNSCTGSAGRGVSFSYTVGQLTGIPGYTGTVPGQASGVGITYFSNGLVNQVAHANGVVWAQLADPTRMARPGGYTSTLNGTTLWNTGSYAYDGAGNVTRIGSSYYLYDNVSRIGTASFSTLALDGGTPTVQSYSYDPFGNLTALAGANGRNIPTAPQTNHLNAPGTTYDGAGNLTAWNGATYEYDAFDQLRHYVNGTEEWLYMYDADDERVWSFKVGASPRFDRWTLRGLDNQVRREYDVTGWAWNSWTTGGASFWEDFVYRDGHLLESVYPAGQQRHYDIDHLGSPRLVTNFGAAQTAYHVYYPYGEEATAFNQDTERLKFTGHERDLASAAGPGDDLDYMHARFFGPVAGRFLGTDLAPGKPKLPQSWNRYLYAYGNPIQYTDPDGRETGSVTLCPGTPCGGPLPWYQELALWGGVFGSGAAAYGLTAITVGGGVGAELSAAFRLPPVARGNLIEKILAAVSGGGLPRTFPVIDRFKDGVATSVKSIDLAAKTYQNVDRLQGLIEGFVDKLAGFQGAAIGLSRVTGSDITTRVLEIVVQAGALTTEQAIAIKQAAEYAQQNGVVLKIIAVR